MARVQVVYMHPLFIPLISQILDGFDGATDQAYRLGTSEEIRVSNGQLSATDIRHQPGSDVMQHMRTTPTPLPAPEPGSAERGQGLVEFALILPLVVLMFFGIIQFGFTLGGHIALVNAVREATRYASASAPNSTNPTPADQATTAIARAVPGYTRYSDRDLLVLLLRRPAD